MLEGDDCCCPDPDDIDCSSITRKCRADADCGDPAMRCCTENNCGVGVCVPCSDLDECVQSKCLVVQETACMLAAINACLRSLFLPSPSINAVSAHSNHRQPDDDQHPWG